MNGMTHSCIPIKEESVHVTETTAEYGYGFNFSKTGVFKNLLAEFEMLLDVKDPDSKTLR